MMRMGFSISQVRKDYTGLQGLGRQFGGGSSEAAASSVPRLKRLASAWLVGRLGVAGIARTREG
jgi:hypothetical protein